MKKVKLQLIALVLVATTGFTSCSNEDEPAIITKKAFVSAVNGPAAGAVNEELTLTVSFAVENNCGVFNKFVETPTEANTKVIEVETVSEGTNCDAVPATKTVPYKFKATAAGTYILKFKKSATEFVTQTIVISSAA